MPRVVYYPTSNTRLLLQLLRYVLFSVASHHQGHRKLRFIASINSISLVLPLTFVLCSPSSSNSCRHNSSSSTCSYNNKVVGQLLDAKRCQGLIWITRIKA